MSYLTKSKLFDCLAGSSCLVGVPKFVGIIAGNVYTTENPGGADEDIEKQIEILIQGMANINSSIQDINENISSLQTVMEEVSNTMETLQGTVGTLQENVNTVTTDVTSLKSDVSKIKTTLSNHIIYTSF